MKKPKTANPDEEIIPNLTAGHFPIMTIEVVSCTGQDVTYSKCSKCRDLTGKAVSNDSNLAHSFVLAGTPK